MKNPCKVIIHDETDTKLRTFWRLGSLFDGACFHYGVSSVRQLYMTLEAHVEVRGHIQQLQFWGHANSRGMLIDDRFVNMRDVVSSAGTISDYVWFRGCELAENPGRIERYVDTLGCAVVAHTHMISAEPWWRPLWQGGIVALRPDEATFWNARDRYTRGPKVGRRLRGCYATRMKPPAKATVDGGPVVPGLVHVFR